MSKKIAKQSVTMAARLDRAFKKAKKMSADRKVGLLVKAGVVAPERASKATAKLFRS